MDEAIDSLISILQEIIASGEEIPDEMIDTITDVLTTYVQGLAQERATPETFGKENAAAFPSSNINAIKFNPDTGELFAQFHGPYPQAAGSIYKYQNVPKYIFDILARGAIGPKTSGENQYHKWVRGISPSMGGSFNALIKAGKFPFQKVA